MILSYTDFFTALRSGASDLTLLELKNKDNVTIRTIQEARPRKQENEKTEILLSNADKFLAFCFFQRNTDIQIQADDLLCRASRFKTGADLPLRCAFSICDCKYAALFLPKFCDWAKKLDIYAFARAYNNLLMWSGIAAGLQYAPENSPTVPDS